ncbi:MAG: tRNA epoxyqueuosine(34) reductase QueG [Bdellovibrionaceae bacterium]|nr:tRNA epoxyqueuosine(34) reductase QueG [Pseudobdellovibrionaceae bacterium]
MTNDIIARVELTIKNFDFTNYSFAKLQKPLTIDIYENWLNKGLNAEMQYLERHLPIKKDPHQQWPQAKSLIVFTQNYLPHPSPLTQPLPLKFVKISKYAQGHDYHFWLKERLNRLCLQLKEMFPEEEFIPMTDSVPLLERNWAFESGLGWFGKNTCLIHPKYGSFHFIAEILTTLELESQKETLPDFCGKCNKCIEACPTQALEENKILDANKCISYWTIETRKTPPRDIINNFGSWLFGCDICQDVCPWNIKAFSVKDMVKCNNEKDLIEDLKWILEQSNKQLLKKLKGSPLTRAGANGIKKNAIQMAGHYKFSELEVYIKKYLNYPVLSEICEWTLAQFQFTDNIKKDE